MRMENPEALLDDLNEFTVRPPEEIPRPLENLLVHIAHTGDIVFPWTKLLPLIKLKLCAVLDQFHNSFPADEIAVIPNVPVFKYDVMRKRLIDYMDTFTSAPFTIQRICELITEPRRHYKRTDKFMRALEKTMLVVTTIEPHRNGGEGRRSPMMNGIVERSSSSSSSSPSSPQSTDSNEKTSESDPEQLQQPNQQAMLEGQEDFTNTNISTSEEKLDIKSGNLDEEYDDSSSSLSVDLPDETESLLADHLLGTQSILVSNSETPVNNATQISTQSLLTETTPTNNSLEVHTDNLESESSLIDINANPSTVSVIKTWDDYSRTNVCSADNVSSSDNPRVEDSLMEKVDDKNAATSSTDVDNTNYAHIAYSDTSATSTYPNISHDINDSSDIVASHGDASSSSDKESPSQDTVQAVDQDSVATSDQQQIPDDGNVLMAEQTPDDGTLESNQFVDNSSTTGPAADQTPGPDDATPDNSNDEHVDVMSVSEADATDEMQVSDERSAEVETTEDTNMGSEAETSAAPAVDEGAEAQATTSGDMLAVDNVTSGGDPVTSAVVEATDNVTSGETVAADVSSAEIPISAEAIDNSLGSEAETTGGEENRTAVSPVEPSESMYSCVQESTRFVEASTSENEGVVPAPVPDNMCSEATSTDAVDADTAQFVDSPCSEVSGSDEQSQQGGELVVPVTPDPVSQSDETVSEVTSQPQEVSPDQPSQSYHEDMEVDDPNQKSPDDDVSSSETVSAGVECDAMLVVESGGSKEADSTDNHQPMEET